jgi:2-iminobutanoate/2-iminopropanoate deaminase
MIMKRLLVFTSALFMASAALADKTFFDPYEGAAPFSAAVRVGDTLYLSGMLGTKDRKLVEGGVGPETAQTLANIAKRLEEHDLTMADVVKCSVFLADIADFAAMNEVYAGVFQPPRPTRTTVAVSGLALDAKIEIECIAAF